ncbi:MAG TPA: hypothetical protein VG056_05655 [Pirellulales bacterium]|jgi:uncharacterized membrane protein YtjA (UPF0391 family)|nr:hypothetical protein [Pirellulales bacterium]
MWRFAILPLMLAIVAGALFFACESATATGLAGFLVVAFLGLCAIMLAAEGHEFQSLS